MKTLLRVVMLVSVFALTSVAGYSLVCWWKSAHSVAPSVDELAWLQSEYQLTDEEFSKVKAAHEAYQPECMDMCHKIEAANSRLSRLLETSSTFTAEIETALQQVEQTNADCRAAMLRHVYLVAALMPPDTGRRYARDVIPCLLERANAGSGMRVHASGTSPSR